VLNLLKEFEAHTGQPITFDALGLAFGEAFTTYLTGTVGQSNSTAEKRLKILKTFLLDCQRRGLITEVKLGKPAYLKKIEATHVALSGAELNRLESLDLAHHPRLARVRDVFCFGCHTGLRFSDLCQLRPEHLQTLTDTVGQPVRALVLPMQKTARRITVPLNAYASSIVERHGLPLPTLTNQRTNDYLKELCQLAGFSTPVVLEQMKGATRVQTAHPKHELITTHTARRTFATLARERGMPWEVLRDCLGHRSIAETERYVKSTLATQLTETLNTWR
jgi:integrase